MGLRDLILAADDQDRRLEPVPEWGVKIELRSMSSRMRGDYMALAAQDDALSRIEAVRRALVVTCCFDPDTGERVFADSDIDALAEKHAGAIERLAELIVDISGLGAEGKDSTPPASANTGSSSPSGSA